MQIIDVNCMLGEWAFKNLRFKAPAELLDEMQRLGIVKSLVFSSNSWQNDIKTGNHQIVEMVKDHAERLLPVAALTPLIRQEFGGKQPVVDFLTKNHIAAVRLFPSDHHFSLDLWCMEELFEILDEMHMLVLIEGREQTGSIDSYYQQIYDLASKHKNVDFVLLTVGYRSLRTIYCLFDNCSNIHIDTSTFITFRGIEDMVRYYGSERILFGSRMPFMEAAVSVGRIIYADIDASHKENIAYRNVLRLLGRNKNLNVDREAFLV